LNNPSKFTKLSPGQNIRYVGKGFPGFIKGLPYMTFVSYHNSSHCLVKGFVLFVNANSVSGPAVLFSSWHPAGGGGLRIKFNKGSNTNIGIDYGMSKGYRSIMFKLGEAF